MNSKNDHEIDKQVELDVRVIIQQLGISDHNLKQVITPLEEKKG